MKLVLKPPPNYKAICARVGVPPLGAVFTWGEKLYMPNVPFGFKPEIEPDLAVHEAIHTEQQHRLGRIVGPRRWWARWLDDLEFRRQQEVEAYAAQLRFFAQTTTRQLRRQRHRELAKHLSSGMYGRVFTFEQAMEAIA